MAAPTPTRTTTPAPTASSSASVAPSASANPSPANAASTACPTLTGGSPIAGPRVAAVRAAHNPGFDRLVIEFTEQVVPQYEIKVASTFTAPSGLVIRVDGNAFFSVRVGGQAHTDAGQRSYPQADPYRPAPRRLFSFPRRGSCSTFQHHREGRAVTSCRSNSRLCEVSGIVTKRSCPHGALRPPSLPMASRHRTAAGGAIDLRRREDQ